MYCNQGGRYTNLSEGENRKCAFEKCGGWRYLGPSFTKYFSKSGGVTGAWLPAATVCSAGIYFIRSSSGSSSSGATLAFSMLSHNEHNLGWMEFATSYKSLNYFPDDMVFSVHNSTYDGQVVYDLVSVGWDGSRQAFVMSSNRKYVLDGSVEASFQFNINDPRFGTVRKKFVFRHAKDYETSAFMYPRINNNYVSSISPSSVDFLHDFLVDYWENFDETNERLGPTPFVPPFPSYPAPADLPQDFGSYFAPFAHATYKILLEVPFDTYSSWDEYQSANIDLIKSHSLDKVLIDWFYNVGPAEIVDLDAAAGFVAMGTSAPPAARVGVEGSNFLGVNPETFGCMLEGKGRGGELYRNYSPFDYGKYLITGPNGLPADPSFDCRSFSESASIALKASLSESCPEAEVCVYFVEGHAINEVNLGGVCADGMPCDCCKGTFLYEPQGGYTFDNMDDYTKKTGRGKDIVWGGCQDPNFDIGATWRTGWEYYDRECKRIAEVICGCLQANPLPGSSEHLLLDECKKGNMPEWFKENFAYSAGSKNGPGKVPQLPIAKSIGCDRWICDSIKGPAKDPNGDLTEHECKTYCKERWSCDSNYDCNKFGYSTQNLPLTAEECSAGCTAKIWCEQAVLSPPCPPECCGPVIPISKWRPATKEEHDRGDFTYGLCNDSCKGAWCTGEFKCDEKFYADGGCKEGYYDVWRDSYYYKKKAKNFEAGKKCSELNCVVDTHPADCDCYYQWIAEYDCDSYEWILLESHPTAYFGEDPKTPLDEWADLPNNSCLKVLTKKQDSSTTISGCGQNGAWPSNSPPPSLPASVPGSCCGAWCYGRIKADGSFSSSGCKFGRSSEWALQPAWNGSFGNFNFESGKKCEELLCYGSWCAGEVSCDGKFYISDCASGSHDEYEESMSKNTATGEFNAGKDCHEIECEKETPPECVDCWVCVPGSASSGGGIKNIGPLTPEKCMESNGLQNSKDLVCCFDDSKSEWTNQCDKKCVYEWVAKYNCQSGDWNFTENGHPHSDCGYPLRPQNQWEYSDQLGTCYRVWNTVTESCFSIEGCEQSVPQAPELPKETPKNCCFRWCELEVSCGGEAHHSTGKCVVGSLKEYFEERKAGRAGDEVKNTCDELTCVEETPPECGCCCLDGSPDPTKTTRSTCESAGGTWKAGEPCEQTKCGCCCLSGGADTSKTTQLDCEGAGGTWLASKNCNSNPCQGQCCCIDGYVTMGLAQSECEDCTVPPAQCREYFSAYGMTSCPPGFEFTAFNIYCERRTEAASCSECPPQLREGSQMSCYQNPPETCGSWYKECSTANKYYMKINYTLEYWLACSDFDGVYVGLDGSGNFSTCQYRNNGYGDNCGPASVGGWSTWEECNDAFWSLYGGPAPDFVPGGCDWPPSSALSGCPKNPRCADSNDG